MVLFLSRVIFNSNISFATVFFFFLINKGVSSMEKRVLNGGGFGFARKTTMKDGHGAFFFLRRL